MDLLEPPLKSKKIGKADQSNAVSIRFKLSLKTTSDSECPEFSYLELVKDHNKKNKLNSKTNNEDAKEKQDAETMAKYFEQKYGVKRKRKDRMRDLADVGYGYDETDPFVDNSEFYDELIPSSLTTQFGGFYINSGKLEFKHVSDDSNLDDEDSLPLASQLKKGKLISSEEDTNDSIPWKKVKKRKTSLEREEKRRKLSLQGKEKLGKLAKSSKKTKVQLLVAKARKAQHHSSNSNSADKLTVNKHKKKKKAVVNGANEHISVFQPVCRGTLVYREIMPSVPQKITDTVTLSNSSHKHSRQTDGYLSSSSDEVSLARLSSREDKIPSSKEESKSTTIKEEPKLPQSIPFTIKEKINSLTKIAKTNENEGKVKFFSPDVNHLLLGIEVGSQSLSNRERSGIYQHLTPHMPCSKDTLIRRMKKLHQTKQDENVRAPLADLKRALDDVMQEQSKRYDEECAAQQLAKLDDRLLVASTDEDDDGVSATPSGEEKTKRTYAPRRKFQWNDKIRTLLYDVIKVKLKQLEENKNKQNIQADEYLKNFLESEVKGLWPKGWMQSRVLYKESRHIHGNVTGDMPKTKKAPPAPTRKPGKSEKKISSNPPSESGSKSKEASMSVSMSLNSSSEDMSPMKRAELMNRAILSAQKEMSQPKQVRKKQQDSEEAGKNCYVKLSSVLKDAALNMPQQNSEPAPKPSEYKQTVPKKDEFLSIDELLNQPNPKPSKPKQDRSQTQFSADEFFKQLFATTELPLPFSVAKNLPKTPSTTQISTASKSSTSKNVQHKVTTSKDLPKQVYASKDTPKLGTTFRESAKHFSTSKDPSPPLSKQLNKPFSKDASKPIPYKEGSKQFGLPKTHLEQVSASKDPVTHVFGKETSKPSSSKTPSKQNSSFKESTKRSTGANQVGVEKKHPSSGFNDKQTTSVTSSQINDFNAELLKLALMPPGVLSTDELSNFMKMQQASLEKQLRKSEQTTQRSTLKQHRTTDTSPKSSSKQQRAVDTSNSARWSASHHKASSESSQNSLKQRSAEASPQRKAADVFFPFSQSASSQSFSKSVDVKAEKLKISGSRKEERKHQHISHGESKKYSHQLNAHQRSYNDSTNKPLHQNDLHKRFQSSTDSQQIRTQAHSKSAMQHQVSTQKHSHTTETHARAATSNAQKRSHQTADFTAPKRPVAHEPKRAQSQNDFNPFTNDQVISSYLQNSHGNTVNSSPQIQHQPMSTSNHFSSPSNAAAGTSPRSASKDSFRVADLQKSENSDRYSMYSGSFPTSFVASDNMSTQLFTSPSSMYRQPESLDIAYKPPLEPGRFVHPSMSSSSQLDDAAMEALLSVHQHLRPGTGNRR